MDHELNCLRAELYRHEGLDQPNQNTVTMAGGEEREFYAGERSDAILFALKHGRKNLAPDGRRVHLIDGFLQANTPTEVGADLEDSLKEAFAKSGDLGQSQRRTLEELGFVVEEAGKHWKVLYHGDGRYTFSIGKTSSDHRAGKNLASTIIKKLLK